jgi:hypothetical protein
MATTLETTIEYYKDLLLYQYINLPKARAVIGLLVSQALVDLLPVEMSNAFDLETATGAQLDILGEYIGFDRRVVNVVDRDYFNLDNYVAPTSNPFGFTDYTAPAQNANNSVYSYYNSNNQTDLNDDEFRILLKLKAAMNISNFSMYDIVTIINEAFGTLVVVGDSQNMKMSYFVAESISRIATIARNEALLPKPMGVGIFYLFSLLDPTKLWGFASYLTTNNATIGFSSYAAWADGELLNYGDRII